MGLSSVDANNVQGAGLPALTSFTVSDFAKLAWPQETFFKAESPKVMGPESKAASIFAVEQAVEILEPQVARKAPEKIEVEKRKLHMPGFEQFGHWHTPLYGAAGIRPRW